MERKIKPMKDECQKNIEAKQEMLRDTRDPRGLLTFCNLCKHRYFESELGTWQFQDQKFPKHPGKKRTQ
jgi:hypothetical protein